MPPSHNPVFLWFVMAYCVFAIFIILYYSARAIYFHGRASAFDEVIEKSEIRQKAMMSELNAKKEFVLKLKRSLLLFNLKDKDGNQDETK